MGQAHLEFVNPIGASQLSPEAKKGLIPTIITNQSQLNDLENKNIRIAMNWAFSQKRVTYLTYDLVLKLHERMFDHVWSWAGLLRRSETNIGVLPAQIPMRLKQLIDTVNYWLEFQTYSLEELVIRMHVDLVRIHAFENGNGRHARLLADIILFNYNRPFLRWGSAKLDKNNQSRIAYIDALKIADSTKNYQPIIDFCSK